MYNASGVQTILRKLPRVTGGERIRKARQARRPRVTQDDLAAQLRISRAKLANYESGRTEAPPLLVDRAMEILGERPLGTANVTREERSVYAPQIRLVPYWGTVPCGEWDEPSVDEASLQQISDQFTEPNLVAVRVAGNSMEPRLHHGQIVVVKIHPHPQDGLIALARNGHNELTLKVARYRGGEWVLESINPEFGAASASEWSILGYAIGVEEHDRAGLRP